MEILAAVLAIILTAVGLLGAVLPGLPGLPLNYAALWLLQWQWKPFSATFLIVMGAITLIVLILDYVIPVWSAKIFGATKQGIWGSIIGMIAGIFFTPIGMMAGILIGAIVGDMWAGRKTTDAIKSGIGTFAGTLIALAIKVITGTVMAFAVFIVLIKRVIDIF